MKIAIMGVRGVPANYGGFETFAEQLSTRLVRRGHEVTVYGRRHYVTIPERVYKGVELVVLPTIKHKYLDTVVHTFLTALHAWFKRYDVVLICNAANALAAGVVRLSGKRTALNVDGIERQRKKWNWLGRSYYLVSEWLATKIPHAVVTDARVIQAYYQSRFGKESTMIPYGAEVERKRDVKRLRTFGLEPEKYILYVSRLEPENNAHVLIEAFEQTTTDLNLVVVGDAPYAQDYIRRLKATRDPRIIFTGYVFGEGYRMLQQNAYCYVHATEVGGTHPALIEAMGFGNCVVALDTPENREVVADAGLYYRTVEELKTTLRYLVENPSRIPHYREQAMARIKAHYDWEVVTDQYERLFADLTALPRPQQRKQSARMERG
ncbi:MAG: glycosyltransferase [Acidobacteria bacterium]|nr:glycosyltransferase [Acidobacteriota bacterium]